MISKRIETLTALKDFMDSESPLIGEFVRKAYAANPWFTPGNIRKSLESISNMFLDKERLEHWISRYPIADRGHLQVGLVMAGNIPLVGFQDWLNVFMAGYDSLVKLSSKDAILLPFLVEKMYEMVPGRDLPNTRFVERLKDFDAIIATGSDNTAMHFEHYFKHYPNIIRHNRNSVAFLSGEETEEQLIALGMDIFDYYGLGCRNVSHIFLPLGYDLRQLVEVFDRSYPSVIEHHKYRNNYDYNLALYLLNKIEHIQGKSIIFKRDDHIASRIASLNYSFYDSEDQWPGLLRPWKGKIQVVVAAAPISGIGGGIGGQSGFGAAQTPGLTDYPDGIDTMQVLTEWYSRPGGIDTEKT